MLKPWHIQFFVNSFTRIAVAEMNRIPVELHYPTVSQNKVFEFLIVVFHIFHRLWGGTCDLFEISFSIVPYDGHHFRKLPTFLCEFVGNRNFSDAETASLYLTIQHVISSNFGTSVLNNAPSFAKHIKKNDINIFHKFIIPCFIYQAYEQFYILELGEGNILSSNETVSKF